MQIYDELVKNGVKVDHHESDLYAEITPLSQSILLKYPIHHQNATRFRSNIDGTLWFDIPFAYEPFWQKRVVNNSR